MEFNRGARTEMKTLTTLALCAVLFAQPSQSQGTATRASVDSMITFFAGHWSCEGQFANGSPIAADITFEATLDSKFLSYAHVDRPPGRFKMTSFWGFDVAAKGLISAGADNGGGLRIFRAPGWNAGEVTFERASLGDSLARRERFVYRMESDARFRMTYEIGVGTRWVMGDFLICTRSRE